MSNNVANRTKTPVRTWLTILGVTLLAIALLGLFTPVVDFFHNFTINIEGGEDVLHWVLGFATLGLAFGLKDDRILNKVAIAYGAVYVVLGLIGFVSPNLAGPAWHVGLGDNLLHIVLGGITIATAVASREHANRRVVGRPMT